MNHPPIVSETSLLWASEFDLDIRVFDQWMTRQLNCLVGRNLKFATRQKPTSQDRNSGNSPIRGRDNA
jgi:hypothetical protein